MHTPRLRSLVALLVAIHYLALVSAVPFLHRHAGLNRAPERAPIRQATLTRAPAPSDSSDTCPACAWDQLSKAPPATILAWTLVERMVARATCPPAESLSCIPFGLPSSRAPPALPS